MSRLLNIKKIQINLEKYVDPVVLEQINDPDLINLQNKILTGIFWDISGFSILCEIPKEHTELVVEFLKKYCSETNRIVHKIMEYWINLLVMEHLLNH